MPGDLCVRRVERRRWVEDDRFPFDAGDAPAWCLKDMAPDNGENLSVWVIPADQRDHLLPLLVAALAARRNALQKLDLSVCSASILTDAGFPLIATTGKTGIAEVNACHRDIEVTALSVARLAGVLFPTVDLETIEKEEVSSTVASAIAGGKLNVEKSSHPWVRDLAPPPPDPAQ